MTQITVKGNVPFNGSNLADSSEFERRQNTFIQLHNREVREVFADVVDATTDGTPYDASKITPQNSARRVMRRDVLMTDNDSFSEMWMKRELLKFMKDDDNNSIILPNYDDIPISVKDKPHVHLHFIEKKSTAIIARRRRVETLISFRITDKTISTITQTDLNELKREINLAFPSTYQLKRGRFKYSYRDKENGFELILTLLSETEAREVITKVLSIRDKTPDFEILKTSTSEKNFTIRKNVFILNQIEKLPLERPITDCYLQKAMVTLGKFKKIPLITRAV